MIVLAKRDCRQCGAYLPLSEYYRHPSGRDGHGTSCRECVLRDQTDKHRISAMLGRSKARAKKQQLDYNLDKTWLRLKLLAGLCEFSGVPFVNGQQYHPFSPSLDRVDPSLGYTKDNCKVILLCLNGFKGTASMELFTECMETVSAAFVKGRQT